MAGKKLTASSSIELLPGVGPKSAEKLKKLGIDSIWDLLHHYPNRYLDYRKKVTINQVRNRQDVSFLATIGKPSRFTSKTGKLIIQSQASDSTGKIKLTWFNNPYINRLISPGENYLIAGKATLWSGKLTLISPILEKESGQSLHTRGLVPIYPQTAKLNSHFIRQKIRTVLDNLEIIDPLAQTQIEGMDLLDYRSALFNIHFPKDLILQNSADRRLAFNQQVAINLDNQIELGNRPPTSVIKIDKSLHEQTLNSLPFTLTLGQKKAVLAGYRDMAKPSYTHRLIQGETGSGKTIVAFFLAVQTIKSHRSFVIMAPTQILANQHYLSFKKLGLTSSQLTLVTHGHPFIASNKPTIYIGTHALLNQLPKEITPPIAAVVIDEQHRFGVEQRQKLIDRSPTPHLFNLTATPIPRTLALGIFGEIEITTILTKPKERLPIKTWVVNPTRFKNSDIWLKTQLDQGSKIFVVVPLIHASEKLNAQSTEKIYDQYRKKFSKTTKLFLIHGQMAESDINSTLEHFKESSGGILVSTSIIEVGVDIPQADIIIIHSAERFGLASLHQLRGRVGRGTRQSYCFLIPTSDEQEETERLKLLEKYHSAIMLSKMDLRLRGFGQLFGVKQHGWSTVRLKNFYDKKLFLKAKILARQLIAKNKQSAAAIANALVTW